MKPPTIPQLRIIVGRAYRGPLTPDETARLSVGIERLAARPTRNPGAGWANRTAALRRKLTDLHYPVQHEQIAACAECSGWNGRRCVGLVQQWPCNTLAILDDHLPAKESA